MTGNCPRILFVCTGNAGRSQMAQAMARAKLGDAAAIESAGVEPWDHLHPMAVEVMTERRLDFSGQHPKHVQAVADNGFDLVVTIGTPARTLLPNPFPGDPRILHWDVDDPADADGTSDSKAVFRRTADRIRSNVDELAASLGGFTHTTPDALPRGDPGRP